MVANILPADPLPILGVGLNGQNSTVSEYSHVAYQIKGDDACSDMVVKKFQQTPPPPPPPPAPPDTGSGIKRSKFIFFRIWSRCILNYMEYRIQQHGNKYFARGSSPPPPPDPGKGSEGQNLTLSEHGHVAYQMKCNYECSSLVANSFCRRTPPPRH